MAEQKLDFFLGALSPTGFCGYYSQINQNTQGTSAALLKSAPGSGKSTLLKKTANKLLQDGEMVELIHCSQDPESLDGVICPRRKFAIVDATAPHSLEPAYPGAFEDIISLYHAQNREYLQAHRSEIVLLFDRYTALQERATRYITAAGSLLQDSMRVAASCTDIGKVRALAQTLAKRYFTKNGDGGAEEIRLLSAVSGKKIVFYSETIFSLAQNIIIIDDEFGAASKIIMYSLREQALLKKLGIITCYCSMSPYDKIEHLLIPEISTAFVTSNSYHNLQLSNARKIHSTRFCSADTLKAHRTRLKFNKKAAAELFCEAVNIQNEAKQTHDEIEKYYLEAIDFSVIDDAFKEICSLLD